MTAPRAACRTIRLVLILITMNALLLNTTTAQDAETPVKLGPWKYLYGGPVKSLKQSPVEFLEGFEITGAHAKHPFRLNEVICDGEWGLVKGALQQTSGRSAALKLGTAEDFELELGLNAEGEGGWFLLFGFNDGKGFGIYNVNMRTSGSPWFLTEFVRNQGIEETDHEFARYVCRGNEPVSVKVINGQLSLQVSRRVLLDQEELPGYAGGDLILGTYDTNYGPKPLKIFGIRMRTALGDE